MSNRVFVIGVGLTKYLKPSKSNPDYPQLGKQAAERALRDAEIQYSLIEQAVCAYSYGDTCCGQMALYEVGITGIPIYNTSNAGATGASALHFSYQLVKHGAANCVMTLGFEKLPPGPLPNYFPERTSPWTKLFQMTEELEPGTMQKNFTPVLFGNAGLEHQKLYGTKDEHFAKIAYKNHLHSVNNPYSSNREKYTLEQIMKSPKIYGPLTKLQCCPNADGAACAILANEKFVKDHGLEDQAVEIVGMVLKTDPKATFAEKSLMNIAGYAMCKDTAQSLYKMTGISPKDVQIVELHDCFSTNELITYEAIGLCPEGKGPEYVDKYVYQAPLQYRNAFTYGGLCVVNPSGGLISKGHPLGATGIAQCAELSWQLRGMALKRQVPNCKYALQHTIGLGGACVMGIYKKYNDKKGWKREDQTSDPDILEQIEKKSNFQTIPDGKSSYQNQIKPKL